MKKLILLFAILASGVAQAQYYKAYKWESMSGSEVKHLRPDQSPIFDITDSYAQVLYPSMKIRKYVYSRMKGKYRVYESDKYELYYDKKNKLVGIPGGGIFYLSKL